MNSSLPLRYQLIKARWMKTLRRRDGSALLVVLAFVLLLTVITLAFLSRSLLEKKVSDASAYQTRTDIFASSAVGAIISDFQAEIAAGSNDFASAAILKSF